MKPYKKAEVSIIILVLGVFAICALAIISFLVSDSKVKDFSVGLMESVSADLEKFYFYKNVGDNNKIAAEKIDASIEGNFLVIEREDEFMKIVFNSKIDDKKDL